MSIKDWVKAVRAPFFTATIIPVVLGSVIAWHDKCDFVWWKFWLVLAGMVLIHAGVNLANDYFDHRSGCDEKNHNPTPFSGGSRVIQEGLIAPKLILSASLTAFIAGAPIGLYLNYLSGGNVILLLGVIGVFLGFFYTAKPFRIGYGSFGELATGIGFGPLIVMGSYYVQAKVLPLEVFLASIPIAILIALVLFINEFPDYQADKAVNKKTLVVIMGKKKAAVLYHTLLFFVYFSIIVLVTFEILPLICLIALFTVPMALKAFKISRGNFDKIYELLPANRITIALHFAVGILLSLGIVIDKYL